MASPSASVSSDIPCDANYDAPMAGPTFMKPKQARMGDAAGMLNVNGYASAISSPKQLALTVQPY